MSDPMREAGDPAHVHMHGASLLHSQDYRDHLRDHLGGEHNVRLFPKVMNVGEWMIARHEAEHSMLYDFTFRVRMDRLRQAEGSDVVAELAAMIEHQDVAVVKTPSQFEDMRRQLLADGITVIDVWRKPHHDPEFVP